MVQNYRSCKNIVEFANERMAIENFIRNISDINKETIMKRIIALLLVAVLCCGLFAACGNEAPAAPAAPVAPAAPAAPAPAAPAK